MVVSQALVNKGLPTTKRLDSIFNDVKDKLGTARGSKDLDEFVSEVLSNPKFRQQLAVLYTKGSDVSALSKVMNAINNFVRAYLLGKEVLPLLEPNRAEKKLSDLDQEILNILAPAPEYRGAGQLMLIGKEGNQVRTGKKIFKEAYEGAKEVASRYTSEQAVDAIDNFITSTVPDKTRRLALQFLHSEGLGETLRLKYKVKVGEELHELIGKTTAVQQEMTRRLSRTRDTINSWLKANPELHKTFDELVTESTYERVDPSRDRSYYSQYFLYDVNNDKEVGFSTKSARDKAVEQMNNAANANRKPTQLIDIGDGKFKNVKTKKIVAAKKGRNANEDTLKTYDDLRLMYDRLRAGGQASYKQLRDTYKELFEQNKKALDNLLDNIPAGQTKTATDEAIKTLKQRLFDQLLADSGIDPYFPLTREGDFWLSYTVKGDAEPVIMAFTSESARKRYVDDLGSTIDSLNEYKNLTDLANTLQNNVPSTSFVAETLALMKANEATAQVQKQFLEVYLDTLPQSSALKALKARGDKNCLLYTSPSPRDRTRSRMPSSA